MAVVCASVLSHVSRCFQTTACLDHQFFPRVHRVFLSSLCVHLPTLAILSVEGEIQATQDRNGGRIASQSGVDPRSAQNYGDRAFRREGDEIADVVVISLHKLPDPVHI
jgi:hypothetical protein